MKAGRLSSRVTEELIGEAGIRVYCGRIAGNCSLPLAIVAIRRWQADFTSS